METIDKYLIAWIILTTIICVLSIMSFFLTLYNKNIIKKNQNDLSTKIDNNVSKVNTDLTNKIDSLQMNNIRGIGNLPIFWQPTPGTKYFNENGDLIRKTRADLYDGYQHLTYEPTPYEYLQNIGEGSIWEYMKDPKLGYCVVHTIIPWADPSGGLITRVAYLNGSIYTKSVNTTGTEPKWTWTAWQKVTTTPA
jgi:hypothetical protein